jgi:hypothetical protein
VQLNDQSLDQFFSQFLNKMRGNIESVENVPSLAQFFARERVITLLAARSWHRAVARLTMLSRSSRKILNSTATKCLGSVRSARGLRVREIVLSFRRVVEIFQRLSPIRSPITFIERPRAIMDFLGQSDFS